MLKTNKQIYDGHFRLPFYTTLMVVPSLNLWDVQLTSKSQNIFSLTQTENSKQPRRHPPQRMQHRTNTNIRSTRNKEMIPSMQILLLYRISSYGGCTITVHEISIIWDQILLYIKRGFLGFVFFVKSLM